MRLDAGEGDARLARLVGLAGQKFLSDLLTDAMSHWRLGNAQPTGLLTKQKEQSILAPQPMPQPANVGAQSTESDPSSATETSANPSGNFVNK